MKQTQLKILIKTILREVYKKKLNEWHSGNLSEYEIELDNVTLPDISTDQNQLIVVVDIDYQSDEGSSERGAFGPASGHVQAGETEVEIGRVNILSVKILDEQGKLVSEIDAKNLTPQQKTMLEGAVKKFIDENEDVITDEILNKESGNTNSGHEDYFEDR